ncbi:Translation initiation factor 2 subunit beta [Dissostichus eleginoides]|uniref:Translation initiation factor 2 subunit beta n=1 Tax=Dissostichus eleginoides TaxID=100907 RepID=A0AAD9C429_DISEL|nr:Translation initiation factor 2 subunit beta [Dissostichus eleginoides]
MHSPKGRERRDSDNQDDNDPLRSKLLLVFMSSLMSLFTHCPMCKENSPGRLRRTMGTFVEIDQNCKHCGFQRLILAALHYNENSGRKHAKTSTGQLQYTVKFPKAKKGGHVVRRVNTAATYEYVTELLTETLRLCENNVDEEPFDVPDPLSSRWEKPDKREAVVLFRSRFNH